MGALKEFADETTCVPDPVGNMGARFDELRLVVYVYDRRIKICDQYLRR